MNNNNLSTNYESLKDILNDTPNHKIQKIILWLITIILLFACLLFVYGCFFITSEDIHKVVINKVFTYAANKIDYLRDNNLKINNSSTILLNGNINFESNSSMLSDLNNYSVNYSLGMDLKNNEEHLSTVINKNDTAIIDGNIYLINNKMYLKSDKLYNGLLYYNNLLNDYNYTSDYELYNLDNIEYFTIKTNEFLLESLDSSKFDRTTVTVNNQKLVENYYIIDAQTISTMANKYLPLITRDKQYEKILLNYVNTFSQKNYTSEELLTILTKYLGNLSTNEKKANMNIKISIYTKEFTSKFMGLSITYNQKEIFKYNDDTKNFTFNYSDYHLEGTIDETTNIMYSYKDNVVAKAVVYFEDGIKFNINSNGYVVDVNLKNELTSSIEENYKASLILTVPYNGQNIETKIIIDSKMELNKEMDKINAYSAKSYNELTNEEKQLINSKILTLITSSDLYKYYNNSLLTETNIT